MQLSPHVAAFDGDRDDKKQALHGCRRGRRLRLTCPALLQHRRGCYGNPSASDVEGQLQVGRFDNGQLRTLFRYSREKLLTLPYKIPITEIIATTLPTLQLGT
jgi:hypothetical protein